ncbi:MAG: AMP-binding protein [Candidatus Dadabacteria bacterium]|nr:AMP-binding protein [Candidatus Dadabacteria bacterium]NIQ17058.1 AMP-binding protein [Candidatus Dadabacteria bacterium]
MQLLFKPRDLKYIGNGDLPNGTFDNTNDWLPITRYLEKGAESYPDKNMFRIGDTNGNIVESYTYNETNEWSNKVSNGLIQEYGIKKGDKVGMYMLNCAEYVISIIAIHKSGAVQVPINKDEKGERLAYVINYSEMKALIIDQESLPIINEISDKLTNLENIFITKGDAPQKVGEIRCHPYSLFENSSKDNPDVDVSVADMERCMFTSGTTGMPKGVARNHGGVIMTVRSFIQQQGIRSEDVLMTVLSLGHANAQVMCLFASIGAGCSSVFFPRFSASGFWKWAADCGATGANMLGAVGEYLWAAPESEWDNKHKVRSMLTAPAPRNLISFQNRFNTKVVEGYGSTEMGMVLWKDPEDDRTGSSGYVVEGYHVEIRNPENTDELISYFWDPEKDPTPPEEAKGLLFIKPLVPHTTLNEYFKDPKRTKEAFDKEGFFNSDDLFAKGIDGRYYFMGRYSRVRVSGENVDPVAVADVAMEYPSIQEAVAVGIRLPNVSDDELKLNVILKSGEKLDNIEFSKWMADKVIVAMVPRFIEVYKEFPLTSTQKIAVSELKHITDSTWDRNKTDLKLKSRK